MYNSRLPKWNNNTPQQTIKGEPPPKPKESNPAQTKASQIEVYNLDDLANGIQIPIFSGSPKEYEIFEKKRHANASSKQIL